MTTFTKQDGEATRDELSSAIAAGSHIRMLRGRVVIREETPAESSIIQLVHLGTEKEQAKARKFHVGTVLSMGPPALTVTGAEVPYGFSVGARVLYHFAHHERAFTREWADGKPATWVPQQSVDAVLETEPAHEPWACGRTDCEWLAATADAEADEDDPFEWDCRDIPV